MSSSAYALTLVLVSRGTIEKIEKDQPVKAVLAARACNALNHYLQNPVTYESLRIKVI
jgi:hypothetical protein